MRRLPWRLTGLLVLAGIAAVVSALSGIAFGWAFLVLAAGVLINGWLATLEDDLPGGFCNPDGLETPRYAIVTGWVIRAVGVLLAVFCVWAIWLA